MSSAKLSGFELSGACLHDALLRRDWFARGRITSF
ncbi:MAG: hypothetical protein F6K65_38120 [Moorea sp. SIO3C2]|nr:hypothetical protein [Moorena sp. SIO3C2]